MENERRFLEKGGKWQIDSSQWGWVGVGVVIFMKSQVNGVIKSTAIVYIV